MRKKQTYRIVTTKSLFEMKDNGEKISMLTAYDYSIAKIIDRAGIDVVLVGDSASNVFAGHETTLPITLDQMIYHATSVVKATNRALVVVDLPFGSYQSDSNSALKSAIRIMKESGAHAVKLEGGERVIPQITAMVNAGIPVMGHIGLTPQSVHQMSGFKVQGKGVSSAKKLIEDSLKIQEAGAFSLVLEGIPTELAKIITERLEIPTIGIGAGPYCDGQIQVFHDILGLDKSFNPKHGKKYTNLQDEITKAIKSYKKEVTTKKFPTSKNSTKLNSSVLKSIS